jgi:hypothetical protein
LGLGRSAVIEIREEAFGTEVGKHLSLWSFEFIRDTSRASSVGFGLFGDSDPKLLEA